MIDEEQVDIVFEEDKNTKTPDGLKAFKKRRNNLFEHYGLLRIKHLRKNHSHVFEDEYIFPKDFCIQMVQKMGQKEVCYLQDCLEEIGNYHTANPFVEEEDEEYLREHLDELEEFVIEAIVIDEKQE